jgi:2-polyprenyl-3-methyl-5-hydroxy-6-metoxy-1,4-benzoquinol methylase
MMIKLKSCPVCESVGLQENLKCLDHSVSKEEFSIVLCNACGFKFTNPRPEDADLGRYYKSDEYISHSDTKKGIVAKLYHMVRSYALQTKISLVRQFVSRGTILDYGCGTGGFLSVCAKSGWKAYGVEPDSGARKLASTGSTDVYSSIADLVALKGDVMFDAITMWHVLEHVPALDYTLKFCKDKLCVSGVLVVALPNHLSLDAKYYGTYWAAYDVPRHLYHFDQKTVVALLDKHGFDLQTSLPMKFDSFYVSMLSEKYKNGRVKYLAAFLQGLRSNIGARSSGQYSSKIYVFKHKNRTTSNL